MSAARQLRVQKSDGHRRDSQGPVKAPSPAENPLHLLRDAIDKLKSSDAGLPDQEQLATLLAQGQEVLERINAIAQTMERANGFVEENKFRHALEVLDAALLAYPEDPALMARRAEVEQQQKALHEAAAVEAALKEAQWLFDQDRIDLAVQFLAGKSSELPNQPAVAARFEELNALLGPWEQKRHVQGALARAATFEEMQQRQAAATLLEEALETYPAAEELIEALRQVRGRLAEQERSRRLARRLDLIGQKIAAQAWREAQALLKDAAADWPESTEVSRLQTATETGLRRSESDALAAEVRQCLADGELESAQEALRKGCETLADETVFGILAAEIESEKQYREQLHTAQVLFGRRQLREAERLLEHLAPMQRPEAQALLDAVRKAGATPEEEDFLEQGRKQAQELMRREQFAQAIDLLRKLLSLDPGNAGLEKDLAAAQKGLDWASVAGLLPENLQHRRAAQPPPPLARQAPPSPQAPPAEVAVPVPPPATAVREGAEAPARGRKVMVTGAAALLLLSGGGVVWKLSRPEAPTASASTLPAAQPPAPTPPVSTPPGWVANPSPAAGAQSQPVAPLAAPKEVQTAAIDPSAQPTEPSQPITPLRPFVPPATKSHTAAPNPTLPSAPATGAAVSATATSLPPAAVVQFVNTASPPVSAPAPPAAAPPAAASPRSATSTGPKFEGAQIVQRTLPVYPAIAREVRTAGPVRLMAHIDENGVLKSVKVVSGNPILARAAIDAVQKWKFKPAHLNGQAVASDMNITLSFTDQN